MSLIDDDLPPIPSCEYIILSPKNIKMEERQIKEEEYFDEDIYDETKIKNETDTNKIIEFLHQKFKDIFQLDAYEILKEGLVITKLEEFAKLHQYYINENPYASKNNKFSTFEMYKSIACLKILLEIRKIIESTSTELQNTYCICYQKFYYRTNNI